MPDIGLGEVVVIAVLALLVFGPDRLPKVAADAGRLLRQVRELATNARRDLVDAAGLQDGEAPPATRSPSPLRALLDDDPSPREPRPPREAGSAAGSGAASASNHAPGEQAPAVQDWT